MRKTAIIVMVLVLVLLGVWGLKTYNASKKGQPAQEGDSNLPLNWWDSLSEIEVEDEWILDPEIPDNYLPVPGEDEVYMVVDNKGTISAYRHREKQEDGSWTWSDITDNIPEGYEALEGQKDIYKYTNADGTVSYFRYVRNSNGTYAFVPVDENGKDATSNDSADTVPDKYINVVGNIYAICNEHGVVIAYKERYKDSDGNYQWRTLTESEVAKRLQSGNVGSSNSTKPSAQAKPQPAEPIHNETQPAQSVQPVQPVSPTFEPKETVPALIQPTIPEQPTAVHEENYTETSVSRTSEVKGNYLITYETTVTKTYNAEGVLISTKKDGPNEIARELLAEDDIKTPNPALIENTLQGELARVSALVEFDDSLANQVLLMLNNERTAAGLGQLTMMGTDPVYMIARIKAADMAYYNHSDYDSPMYGTINDTITRFNIKITKVSETTWKSTEKTANEIHTRFQAVQASREARMNAAYSRVGIAVVINNGYYYIYECLAE